jgi:hypothetical protein
VLFSLSKHFFDEFPHLEFSVVKDAAFCFVCQLFPTGADHEKSNDVWMFGFYANGIKRKAEKSPSKENYPVILEAIANSHKASLEALVAFQQRFQHIDRMMDKEHIMKLCFEAEVEKKRNREAVKIDR